MALTYNGLRAIGCFNLRFGRYIQPSQQQHNFVSVVSTFVLEGIYNIFYLGFDLFFFMFKKVEPIVPYLCTRNRITDV